MEQPLEFTKYWQNKEPSTICLVNDKDCKRAQRCETCQVKFSENPIVASNIVIVHRERYLRPNMAENGQYGDSILTNQLGRKFYCINKRCLLSRRPYFWKGLLKMSTCTASKLNQTLKLKVKYIFAPQSTTINIQRKYIHKKYI